MPITPTYPGVYIEEIPSGVRTITGVSTSVTAFVGYTPRGPADQPRRVFNFGDYERTFGGFHPDSPVSYGISQFFENGGGEAWVVRVAQDTGTAAVTIQNVAAVSVLDIEASSAGRWGNPLRLDIDHATVNPNATFNIGVTEFVTRGTDLVPNRVESFQNLSMNSQSPFFVERVVEATSDLIVATRNVAGVALIGALDPGTSASGDLTSLSLAGLVDSTGFNIGVSIDGQPPTTVRAFDPAFLLGSLGALRDSLVVAINNEFGPGSVTGALSSGVITLTAADPLTVGGETSAVTITNAASNDAAASLQLGVANGGTEIPATSAMRPAQTGTVGISLSDQTLTALNNTSMDLTVSFDAGAVDTVDTISFAAEFTATSTIGDVARTLQEHIRALHPSDPVYAQAQVDLVNDAVRVVMGGASPNVIATFSTAGGASLATPMRVRNAQSIGGVLVNENVRQYALGIGEAPLANQAVVGQGRDGIPGGLNELLGSELDKTGINALDNVDIINILCMPESAGLVDAQAQTLISRGATYAAKRRSFYIIDPPNVGGATPTAIADWYDQLGLQSKNAAIYFPRVRLADPLQNFRLAPFAPSGTMAGLFARTDGSRGVWKAPAGTSAGLRVPDLAAQMTDDENGVLNKLGINCLRTFPIYGRVSWGARTTDGADQKASEWKYVPVRRTALMIEESLFRGLQWAVFEPNDEGLYSQIRVAAGGFMHNLFRQHAFQGTSPRDAYFVKCDRETTTQNDIDLGIVNILVGFAPLKPAEFVILKIQQIAGQVQT